MTLVDRGGGDPGGEDADPGVFTILDAAGERILAVGTDQGADARGLSVEVDTSDQTCPVVPVDDCWQWYRVLPVEVGLDGDGLELFPAEEASLGGTTIYVFRAMTMWTCDDGASTQIAWFALGA